jgi:hypothetical protein
MHAHQGIEEAAMFGNPQVEQLMDDDVVLESRRLTDEVTMSTILDLSSCYSPRTWL